jgi:hypothetical protein
MRTRRIVLLGFALSAAVSAQPHAPVFHPLDAIALDTSGPAIRAHTEALKPFTVAGQRGVLVGQQDGALEAWVLPVKVLSHLTIEANIEGYTVPIDVNQQSAEIEVRPDRTTITYAHIAFSVRQIMFSPPDGAEGTGPVVLFQFDCLHPTDFTLRFTPELRWMWPERNEGVSGAEWVAPGPNSMEQPGGFYVLHSDYPDFAAAVTMPGARPGILAPYQERPQVHPVELKLRIDPARDKRRLYPLLMAYASNRTAANSAKLGATLEKLNADIPASYAAQAKAYKDLLAGATSLETPNKALNEAFQWAEISIEQLKTRAMGPGPHPGDANSTATGLVPTGETALVAGYYASADSARPGFGWFFGRDALYTLYAVNGYGDFGLAKSELVFLIHRQRADGKIMHEWSQTAGAIDWQTFPYMYAAADATPLFLLAMLDYVRSSGDVAFLREHEDAVEKAWAFEITHAPGPASASSSGQDQSGNGIYTNEQGTGWVESWPGGLPHQEVYLALLDQQASAAMAEIEALLGRPLPQARDARRRAEDLATVIDTQFHDAQKGCYAFSRNRDGSLDRTSTVYPALAWWTSPRIEFPGAAFDTREPGVRTSVLTHGDECLKQFADASLQTDWGLRDVSDKEKIYDGMSYHQGSVWPLFTGWAALAEYRGGQPLAGYQMLMENASLTWAQDLGADTELLSGDYFVPFGRSTSHQLWSSAMVIAPALRGLFGIDVDAGSKTVSVDPHLPPEWDHAAIRSLHVGAAVVDLVFTRSRGGLSAELRGASAVGIKLVSPRQEAKTEKNGALTFPLPAVALGSWFQNPLPGDRTRAVRVLSEAYAARQLTLVLEGLGGSEADLPVAVSPGFTSVRAVGAELAEVPTPAAIRSMKLRFPPGDGWKTVTVTLSW